MEKVNNNLIRTIEQVTTSDLSPSELVIKDKAEKIFEDNYISILYDFANCSDIVDTLYRFDHHSSYHVFKNSLLLLLKLYTSKDISEHKELIDSFIKGYNFDINYKCNDLIDILYKYKYLTNPLYESVNWSTYDDTYQDNNVDDLLKSLESFKDLLFTNFFNLALHVKASSLL